MFESTLRKIALSLLFAVLLVIPASSISLSQVNAQQNTQKAQGFNAAEQRRIIDNSKIIKSYDQAGRVDTITVAVEGRGPSFKFKFEYDEKNRVEAIVKEDGSRTLFGYSADGELQRVSYPDGVMYLRGSDGEWRAVRSTQRKSFMSARETPRNSDTINAVYSNATFQTLGSCLAETALAIAATAAYGACPVISDPATCEPLAEAARLQWQRAALACATPKAPMSQYNPY